MAVHQGVWASGTQRSQCGQLSEQGYLGCVNSGVISPQRSRLGPMSKGKINKKKKKNNQNTLKSRQNTGHSVRSLVSQSRVRTCFHASTTSPTVTPHISAYPLKLSILFWVIPLISTEGTCFLFKRNIREQQNYK